MKITRNNIIPFPGYKAINLFGVLFARRGSRLTASDINHEEIHTAQMKETLYIGFYVIYLLNWVINLFRYKFSNNKAYHNIMFEREAYENENYAPYLGSREHFTWIHYHEEYKSK